jgi:hypothetical protein
MLTQYTQVCRMWFNVNEHGISLIEQSVQFGIHKLVLF